MPSPFLPSLVTAQMGRLAKRQDDQQPPQVLAVVHVRKAAGFGAAAEAIEGAQRDIFFVGGGAGGAAELLSRQPDQTTEIALPQLLGSGLVASLEWTDPARDRTVGRHRWHPPQACLGIPECRRLYGGGGAV